MSKQFLCFWGEGYGIEGRPGSCLMKTHPLEFFTENHGYALDDIARIDRLEVGKCADLSDMCGIHTVTRIDDTP